MDSVTIIIVSFNSAELLHTLLPTLPRCHEVIVVDNASSDSSCAVVESCGLSHIRLIRSADNLGFGRANNLALREVSTRYALLLNPDAEISPSSLSALISALESDDRAVIAGPRIIQSGKSEKASKRLVYYPLLHPKRPLFGARLRFWEKRSRKVRDFTRPHETGFISGACFLYDLRKMPELQYFDEDIFMYGDEDELDYRIISAGYRLLWVPYATATHIGQGSSNMTEEDKIWHREYHKGETLGVLSAKYKTSPFLRRLHRTHLLLKQLLFFGNKSLASKAERLGIKDGYAKINNRADG